MRRFALAAFILMPLIAFTRVGSPDTATAGVPTDYEVLMDCDTTAAGVQSACTILPGTTLDVALVFRNNTASPFRIGKWSFQTLNPDASRLFAPLPNFGNPSWNWNPDAAPEIGNGDWSCGPPNGPDNDKELDSDPNTQHPFIFCFNGSANGPVVGASGGEYAIATIHFNVPMMAQPGTIGLSYVDAAIEDEFFTPLAYCSAPSTTCTGATISIPALTTAVDCAPMQAGIQSKCYVSNLTTLREVEVVYRNHTMTPRTMDAFTFVITNPNVNLLSALAVNNTGSMDDNPDAHPNLPTAQWNCGPMEPKHDTGADGDPATQESFMACVSGAGLGPTIMAMNYTAVAKIRYAIAPGTQPGSVVLTPKEADLFDTMANTHSCGPVVSSLAMICQPAEVILYCPIAQADAVHDGRVNSGDIGKVASKFGQVPAPANEDQNFDGMINSGDLGLVASVFNQYVTSCP